MKSIKLVLLTLTLTQTLLAQVDILSEINSTYFGGTNGEFNNTISVDQNGYVYIAGHTASTNLPAKNAYQSSFGGGEADAYLVKFLPDLSDIVFSTYIGGSDYDEIKSIDIDASGSVYIGGLTKSSNFPYTTNAYDTSYNGLEDGFILKFGSNGDLLYSTFFGGNASDVIDKIKTDNSGNVYFSGNTGSADFPATDTLIQNSIFFLSKLNINTNTLHFSTYIEWIKDIAIDDSLNIYIGGSTNNQSFPIVNGFDNEIAGDEGFIAKLNSTGDEILYSTFIGGNNTERIADIEINNRNEIYYIGFTNSTDISCTENALFKSNNGSIDYFIGKINCNNNEPVYLSYFGGSGAEQASGTGIQIIKNGIVAISGSTLSSNYPRSEFAYDKTVSGKDFVYSVININTNEILYSSYIGGTGDDVFYDMQLVNDSVCYLTGKTLSTNFPETSSGYQTNASQNGDNVICRIILKGLNEYLNPKLSFKKLGNISSSGFSSITDFDADNDGDLDLVSCKWGSQNTLWMNDGKGNYTAGAYMNSNGRTIGTGDLDGNGYEDLYIVYGNSDVGAPDEVWFNNGSGNFTKSEQSIGQRDGTGVGLHDLDGDNDIDAFVCNHSFMNTTNGGHKIWLNNGDGQLIEDEGQDLSNGFHSELAMGDVDGDGDIDAAVANFITWTGATNENEIWINDGNGKFAKKVLSTETARGIQMGDLDNDGDQDILLRCHNNNTSSGRYGEVWLNNGSGDFTSTGQKLGLGTMLTPMLNISRLGDLDNDGDLDASVLNEIWLNNGDGSFYISDIEFADIVVAFVDVNNDTDLDVILASGELWLNDLFPDSITTNIKSTFIKKKDIKIYPNPTKNTLHIECPELIHKNISCKIVDLNGKIVQQEKLTGNVIDVSTIGKGIYFLNLNIDDKSLNQKFIIE